MRLAMLHWQRKPKETRLSLIAYVLLPKLGVVCEMEGEILTAVISKNFALIGNRERERDRQKEREREGEKRREERKE